MRTAVPPVLLRPWPGSVARPESIIWIEVQSRVRRPSPCPLSESVSVGLSEDMGLGLAAVPFRMRALRRRNIIAAGGGPALGAEFQGYTFASECTPKRLKYDKE